MVIVVTLLGALISYVVLGVFTLDTDSGNIRDVIVAATPLICGSVWGSAAWIVQTIKKSSVNNKKE
ncbi:hypothetical protein HNQ80_002960 [Anaerosolibacter carboniphilus]|uniref:Uncharacterized protein n=1 Tax=Anaerosolibacter carboniphilus TaxID=1417629 RepID=A0A841L3D9_9FIRM|nr:hypothetical protein [Anaerosolibacter carboniphilus]MBB6216855.1 hypothetical protein [Anaerosolibacter carboniphilus]